MRYHDVIQTLVTIKEQMVLHESNSDDKIKPNKCNGFVTFAEPRRRSSRGQNRSIEFSPPSRSVTSLPYVAPMDPSLLGLKCSFSHAAYIRP